MLSDKLREQGIVLPSDGVGTLRALCPRCSHTRVKRNDRCLSVTVKSDRAVWHCHHCSWSGAAYEDNTHDDEAFRGRRGVRKGQRHQRVNLGTTRRRLRYGIDAT